MLKHARRRRRLRGRRRSGECAAQCAQYSVCARSRRLRGTSRAHPYRRRLSTGRELSRCRVLHTHRPLVPREGGGPRRVRGRGDVSASRRLSARLWPARTPVRTRSVVSRAVGRRVPRTHTPRVCVFAVLRAVVLKMGDVSLKTCHVCTRRAQPMGVCAPVAVLSRVVIIRMLGARP